MKTKIMVWTTALAMGLGLFAVGCSDDDSGSSVDVNKTCSDVCAKQVSCGSSQDQASCESDCHAMLPNLLDGFVTASADCIESHTCSELDDGACENAGQSFCTTDTRPFFEKICAHGVNCQGGTQADIDSCVSSNLSNDDNAMLKCFRKSALDDYAKCVDNLACDANQDQYQACMESSLGIRFEN